MTPSAGAPTSSRCPVLTAAVTGHAQGLRQPLSHAEALRVRIGAGREVRLQHGRGLGIVAALIGKTRAQQITGPRRRRGLDQAFGLVEPIEVEVFHYTRKWLQTRAEALYSAPTQSQGPQPKALRYKTLSTTAFNSLCLRKRPSMFISPAYAQGFGGGTDMWPAMQYCAGLVREPQRTIFVLLSDWYIFGNQDKCLAMAHKLHEEGVLGVGLSALDSQCKPVYDESILKPREDENEGGEDVEDELSDELYDQAIAIVSEMKNVSISMLQRKMRIGYNRAARMIERMERDGVVGAADGAKPREVLVRGIGQMPGAGAM